MDCWDFVFSFVKNHIDALVQQADKYTKEMNEDYEHFFCWYAEEMYKTQRELACYRALKTVLSVGSHEEAKLFIENKISSLTDSLLSGSIRRNSTSAASNLAHTLELEMRDGWRCGKTHGSVWFLRQGSIPWTPSDIDTKMSDL